MSRLDYSLVEHDYAYVALEREYCTLWTAIPRVIILSTQLSLINDLLIENLQANKFYSQMVYCWVLLKKIQVPSVININRWESTST